MSADKPKPISMSERLGDAPIQSELRAKMNAIAKVLDETLNGERKGDAKKWGFVLIAFPFAEVDVAKGGEVSRANYISNARREDVVTMLKEQIKRFEGQPEITGRA
jgi:hypothetical protein